MKTAEFDYPLPPELIAQQPPEDRAAARMLVVDRWSGSLTHARVRDLPEWLRAGDLLVVNETRVIPARLFGTRADTGGRVELLLIEAQDEGRVRWTALFRAAGRARPGMVLEFAGGLLRAVVEEVRGEGRIVAALSSAEPLADLLSAHGVAPLPPYIRRQTGRSPESVVDLGRYQTVYARNDGAIAAPTAGLHFTPELLAECERRGVGRTAVTLHVGLGTFKPVKVEAVEDHRMESERYEVSEESARRIAAVDRARHRVVAVGSTTVRTLESVAAEHGAVVGCGGRTELFIRPPYAFHVVDAMLTNFHLPRSTLIMMVCALAGHELVMRAYAEAVREKYRFYSYGDCMLIV